jgi:hypothetical protein
MGKLGKDLSPLGKLRLLQHLRNYQMSGRGGNIGRGFAFFVSKVAIGTGVNKQSYDI